MKLRESDDTGQTAERSSAKFTYWNIVLLLRYIYVAWEPFFFYRAYVATMFPHSWLFIEQV